MRLTYKKIEQMKRDELKGIREYKDFGLKKLSNDELKHYEYLKKLQTKLYGDKK